MDTSIQYKLRTSILGLIGISSNVHSSQKIECQKIITGACMYLHKEKKVWQVLELLQIPVLKFGNCKYYFRNKQVSSRFPPLPVLRPKVQ